MTTYKYGGSTIRSYGYDDNGNFTSFTGKTLTYGNDNNQLTGDGSRTFTFDEAGRVEQVGSTALEYDIPSGSQISFQFGNPYGEKLSFEVNLLLRNSCFDT